MGSSNLDSQTAQVALDRLALDQSALDRIAPGKTARGKNTQTSNVSLPPVSVAAAHSSRHEVNPALALKLLRDIEQSVMVWQRELRQVVSDIEGLYVQGPMVNGWLESSLEPVMLEACFAPGTETLLRHGDADVLMQYVEALELGDEGRVPAAQVGVSAMNAQYRLCWLDDEGQVRSRSCPTEQMAAVSTAIARYQSCKQLLARQRQLETKLQSTVDGLTGVRDTVKLKAICNLSLDS